MMGLIKKERMKRQEDNEEPENVWIEDPNDTSRHILVKKSDLDDRGFLIEQEDGGE